MKSKKKILLIVVLIFLLGIMLFIFSNKKIVTESKGLLEKNFLIENEVMPLADNEVQIGDQGYLTLEEALAVATSGQEIDLLKNVERNTEIVVPQNVNAVIDLNGFSINNTAVTSTNDNYSLELDATKKLTIKDSVSNGFVNGVHFKSAFGNSELNIGEKDGIVSTTTPIIKKCYCNVGIFNFYDGVLKEFREFDLQNLKIYGTEIGYKPQNNGNEIVLEKSDTIEAKIEEKEYYAIENAISEATDGQTIQILNNISRHSTGSIGIRYDKNIIIDLNGKNIVSNSDSVLWNEGNLEIVDSTSTGNGKIEGTFNMGIENDGQLIIKGGNISGFNNGINSQLGGNIIVEGGTIVGENNDGVWNYFSDVTITGGKIRGKRYGIEAEGSLYFKYNITIGKKDTNVSTTSPIVSGEQYGVYTNGVGTFNFYDGKVIGNTKPIEPETGVNDKPDNYDVVVEGNTATLQLQQHTIKYTIEYYTSNNYKENKEKSETVPITQDKLTVDKNEIKEKTFDGYKFSKITIDKTDYKTSEEIPNEVQNGTTIKVYYLREMTVKAEYLDKATGKPIEKDEITNGVEGDNYKTEEKKITGYKFDSIVGKPEGQMQLEYKEDGTEITEILVKYYYTKVENNVLSSLFGSNNSGGENNPVLSNIISGINTGDAIPIIAISVIGIVVIANVVIIVKRKKNKKA